jgi:hypothetical protein
MLFYPVFFQMIRYLCANFKRMTAINNRHLNGALFLLIIITLAFTSCRKDEELGTSPAYQLSFSTDTVLFDTVFTTIGSTTRILKVYNRNDKRVNISSIRLVGGANSQYQVNVDGAQGVSFSNVEIDANDSLFVFVKVTIDPTNENSPLVVGDILEFVTNGNEQKVELVAWGQDAYFHVGDQYIQGLSYPFSYLAKENVDTLWTNDKPHVIYGWGVVDSAARLTIGPGVNIYFHQNSGLWVYRGGNIIVNGEKDNPITFQGDRLEMEYRDIPGQWDRIWINEGSEDNIINYAVIRNGFIGIQAETLEPDVTLNNTLKITNTVIENMSRWGLFTIASNVTSTNSVFANCAESTLFLSVGGNYDFRHCTFANYWTQSVRQDPSFTVSNNLTVFNAAGEPITLLGNLNARFGNCIVYGFLEEEILLSDDESVDFNYFFDHCLLKTTTDASDPNFYMNCVINEDPNFVDYSENNYRLDTLSAAIDIGSLSVINESEIDLTFDLDSIPRVNIGAGPDAGAYEFIPE